MSLSPEELAALDIAIETLKRSGLAVEADDLLSLREKILALVPRSKGARLETDHGAPARGAGGWLRGRAHVSASTVRSLLPLPRPSRPLSHLEVEAVLDAFCSLGKVDTVR
jgi:hypothetical protein